MSVFKHLEDRGSSGNNDPRDEWPGAFLYHLAIGTGRRGTKWETPDHVEWQRDEFINAVSEHLRNGEMLSTTTFESYKSGKTIPAKLRLRAILRVFWPKPYLTDARREYDYFMSAIGRAVVERKLRRSNANNRSVLLAKVTSSIVQIGHPSVRAPTFELALATVQPARDLAEAASLLRMLINTEFPLFSPGNNSVLSQILFERGPLRLLQATTRYMEAIRVHIGYLAKDTDTRYPMLAFMAFHCMALVKLNHQTQTAEVGLRWLLRQTQNEFQEIRAFALNMLSVVHGKFDKHGLFRRLTDRCLIVCSDHELHWLLATVRFRELHKADWKNGESGQKGSHAHFEDSVGAIESAVTRVDFREARHLVGQRHALIALHHRWDPNRYDAVSQHLGSAAAAFADSPDRSEAVRLGVEAAVLEQMVRRHSRAGIELLIEGIRQRIEIGEYARLRYDLVWLAQAYRRERELVYAATSLHAALRIQGKLYGASNVDVGLQAAMTSELAKIGPRYTSSLKEYDPEYRDLAAATGISGLIWRELFMH